MKEMAQTHLFLPTCQLHLRYHNHLVNAQIPCHSDVDPSLHFQVYSKKAVVTISIQILIVSILHQLLQLQLPSQIIPKNQIIPKKLIVVILQAIYALL